MTSPLSGHKNASESTSPAIRRNDTSNKKAGNRRDPFRGNKTQMPGAATCADRNLPPVASTAMNNVGLIRHLRVFQIKMTYVSPGEIDRETIDPMLNIHHPPQVASSKDEEVLNIE
ncbi:hypothetical protein N7520_002376 [Penicillium odoratum]|uniref:uncharacterized protein n=1 Tax=Penicillium odoratum TaxID=1167516 RepID=UPI002549A436|nr:uncharacterized protein N7520_002376 [Penicillium odoratum]KAJ5771847.1 hypothetical protein N7520_002376 [Penicillium odoratum]